jgi:acylphosphatase
MEIIANEVMKKHYNIWIKGIVQGVFFRKHTRLKAIELSLTGFVRNLPDGRVYIELEGDEENIQAFIKWAESNPGNSVVEAVRAIEHQKVFNYPIFLIK